MKGNPAELLMGIALGAVGAAVLAHVLLPPRREEEAVPLVPSATIPFPDFDLVIESEES